MLELVAAASLLGLSKSVLIALLAVLNGVLALLASIAVWKTYLVVGAKVALTVLICIPIVGILIYVVWGQKKVREAR